MKSISSSYGRVIEQDILKRIELCGKVCYQSSHNIKEGSAEGFVRGICSRGHTSVLEHAPIYFTANTEFERVLKSIREYEERTFEVTSPYIKYKGVGYGRIFVSTSPRVIYNLLTMVDYYDSNIDFFLSELLPEFPEFLNLFPKKKKFDTSLFDIKREVCLVPELARETYNIICDRGIQNEFVRHRNMSFSVESTRYCLYSKSQFDGITIIDSDTMVEDSMNHIVFTEACKDAEKWYLQLVDLGEKAQIARKALPLALKTEMYMSGYVHDWNKVFKLRSVTTAHPEIRVISRAINEELNKVYGDKVVPIIQD